MTYLLLSLISRHVLFGVLLKSWTQGAVNRKWGSAVPVSDAFQLCRVVLDILLFRIAGYPDLLTINFNLTPDSFSRHIIFILSGQ